MESSIAELFHLSFVHLRFKTMQMEFILLPDVDSGQHPNFILLSTPLPPLHYFEAWSRCKILLKTKISLKF